MRGPAPKDPGGTSPASGDPDVEDDEEGTYSPRWVPFCGGYGSLGGGAYDQPSAHQKSSNGLNIRGKGAVSLFGGEYAGSSSN